MEIQAHKRLTQYDYYCIKEYLEKTQEDCRHSKIASLFLCWLINRFNSSSKVLAFQDSFLEEHFLPIKEVKEKKKERMYSKHTIKFARCLLVRAKLIQTIYVKKRERGFPVFNCNYYILNQEKIEQVLKRKVFYKEQRIICKFDGLRKTKHDIKLIQKEDNVKRSKTNKDASKRK